MAFCLISVRQQQPRLLRTKSLNHRLLVEISEKKVELSNVLCFKSNQATLQKVQEEAFSYKNTKYSRKAQVNYHFIGFLLNKALYKPHFVAWHFSR